MEINDINKQLSTIENQLFLNKKQSAKINVQEETFRSITSHRNHIFQDIQRSWNKGDMGRYINHINNEISIQGKKILFDYENQKEELIREKRKLFESEDELLHMKNKVLMNKEDTNGH